jgi:hypothetical protein
MPREPILPIYRDNVSKRNTVGELRAANMIQKSIEMCGQCGPVDMECVVWIHHRRPDNGKCREWVFKSSNEWKWEEIFGMLSERTSMYDDPNAKVPGYVSLHYPKNFRQFDSKFRTGGVYEVPEHERGWREKMKLITKKPRQTRNFKRVLEQRKRLQKLIEARMELRKDRNIPIWSDDDDEEASMFKSSVRPLYTEIPVDIPPPVTVENQPQTQRGKVPVRDIESLLFGVKTGIWEKARMSCKTDEMYNSDTEESLWQPIFNTQKTLHAVSPFILQIERLTASCFFWSAELPGSEIRDVVSYNRQLLRIRKMPHCSSPVNSPVVGSDFESELESFSTLMGLLPNF